MFNHSEIMKEAWAIVRRSKGKTNESLKALLSRALSSAWWQAKLAVRLALESAAKAAARAAYFARLSIEDLHTAIISMKNTDFLGYDGMQRLRDYEDELAQRRAAIGGAL